MFVRCILVAVILALPVQAVGAERLCGREAAIRAGKPYLPNPGIKPLIDDAIERWTNRVGSRQRAMAGRLPLSLGFRQEVCVQLLSIDTSPWSGPIYCYQFIDATFTRAFDQDIPTVARPGAVVEPCENAAKHTEEAFFPVVPEYRPLVDDAIARWKAMTGEHNRAMEYRFPLVMAFPDEVCVQLAFSMPALGGEPTYCYDRQNGGLTRKDDEVE